MCVFTWLSSKLSGVWPLGPLTPFRVGGVSQLSLFLQKKLSTEYSEDDEDDDGGGGCEDGEDDDGEGLTCVCMPARRAAGSRGCRLGHCEGRPAERTSSCQPDRSYSLNQLRATNITCYTASIGDGVQEVRGQAPTCCSSLSLCQRYKAAVGRTVSVPVKRHQLDFVNGRRLCRK